MTNSGKQRENSPGRLYLETDTLDSSTPLRFAQIDSNGVAFSSLESGSIVKCLPLSAPADGETSNHNLSPADGETPNHNLSPADGETSNHNLSPADGETSNHNLSPADGETSNHNLSPAGGETQRGGLRNSTHGD